MNNRENARPEESDLLRAEVDREAPEPEKAALRGRLFDFVFSIASELCTSRLQELARFADVVNNASGSDTPAEEFLLDMARSHYDAGGLTPAQVAHQLDPEYSDGFAYNFQDLSETMERYSRFYKRSK